MQALPRVLTRAGVACSARSARARPARVGHHGRVRPDPADGPPDEPVGGLPAGPPFVVPDDASSLARDAEALRRERRALARRDRLRRLAQGRTGNGIGAPLVLAVLLLVGGVAALPVVLRPHLPADAPSRPLAAPAARPGAVGGLLPETTLDTPAGPLPARDSTRPGVLVLVPSACGCDELVDGAVAQAREFTRNIRLVTDGREPGAGREADRLRRAVAGGVARSGTDPGGVLASAYDARGVTLLAVGQDGVVLDVLRDVQPQERLESRLMVLPDLQ